MFDTKISVRMGSDQYSDSSIVRQSHRQHKCDVRGILKKSLIFCKINGLNIEIHTLQSDSNNFSIYLIFFFSQFYSKVSDYRAVGRSIRTVQDSYPPSTCKHFSTCFIYLVLFLFNIITFYWQNKCRK